MKDYTQERLIELIRKVITTQNLTISINQVRKELLNKFITISDEAIMAAIDVFEDDMYKTKPISYFIAIAVNKQKDIESNIKRDKKRLGSIPKNII